MVRGTRPGLAENGPQQGHYATRSPLHSSRAGSIRASIRRSPWCCLIFALGFVWTIYLQTFIRDEVFFSGDGGIKALMVRQFSRGDFRTDLHLPADPWVRNLWRQGFYPFEPPLVYHRQDRYDSAFHFLFPLLSAPFYALLGYRGLYVLPLVFTWLTWGAIVRFCRQWGLSDLWSAIALATLIFATPLTLYSAMFWEHSLGVFLGTCGLMFLLGGPAKRMNSLGTPPPLEVGDATQGCSTMSRTSSASTSENRPHLLAAASGLCLGLAIWFRPEMYCFAGACGLAAIAFYRSTWCRVRFILFFSILAGTIGCFWLLNQWIYQHPFGVQSLQLLEDGTTVTLRERYVFVFQLLGLFLYEYSRVILFFIFAAPIALMMCKNRAIRRPGTMLYLIAVAFFCSAPLILPNYGGKQWGPRYMLILMPIICLMVAWTLKVFYQKSKEWRILSLAVFFLCFASGLRTNAYQGTIVLKSDYSERIYPSLNHLRNSKNRVVLVSNQWLPQELEAAIPEKSFFRLPDWKDLKKIVPVIMQHGVHNVIVMTDLHDPLPTDQRLTIGNAEVKVEFKYVMRSGENLLFRGRFFKQPGGVDEHIDPTDEYP